MSFFDFFRLSSKKSQKHRAKTTKSLRFETLENREMLAGASILAQLYTDTISTSGGAAAMYLKLEADTSSSNHDWMTIGIVVEAAENSNFQIPNFNKISNSKSIHQTTNNH